MFSTLLILWGGNFCIFIPIIIQTDIMDKHQSTALTLLSFLSGNAGGLLLIILT